MKPATLELCRQNLYGELPETLAPQLRSRILRIRATYTYWIEFTDKNDTEIRDFLINNFNTSYTQAYEDIKIIKALRGDLHKVSKDWHRARFIEMIDESYKMAKKQKDPKTMVAAADKYGKHTQLDKEDAIEIPWDELIFQQWWPTEDPEASGIKPKPGIDKRIEFLENKYSEDLNSAAIDVPFEEIENDPNE